MNINYLVDELRAESLIPSIDSTQESNQNDLSHAKVNLPSWPKRAATSIKHLTLMLLSNGEVYHLGVSHKWRLSDT